MSAAGRPLLPTHLATPLLLAGITILLMPAAGSARNGATPADWQADLRTLIADLEAVHPDPWFHADRIEVLAAVDELDARLPELTWEEAFVGYHRILALLRDGHTRIAAHRSPDLDLRRVQVQYALFPNGLHVIAAPPEHADLLGGRVLRIGSAATDDAAAAMSALIPADNEWTVRDRLPSALTGADLLTGLGILKSPAECPIEVEKDGATIRAVLPTAGSHDEDAWPSVLAAIGAPTPLYLRHPGRSYFLELLPEHDAAYLHFRRVRDDEGESFRDFCERAFATLDEQEVETLVVDLRHNGGGNNYLNRPLIHGIIRNDRVNREGHLFVIVGRRTFSAAMCGTIDLERQTEALFVGEPTGASPNHHGDAVPLVLPRTGVAVSISALFWQNSDPRDRRPWLEPDIPVELTWDDYVAGRDPVLEAALAYEPVERESLARAMLDWIHEGATLDQALARYERIRESDERSRYDLGEYQLNAVGYELLGEGRTEEALRVFRLNAERFPNAYNPWDSLGEALASAGYTDEAIDAYERSVALNPANRAGQARLRELRRASDASSR